VFTANDLPMIQRRIAKARPREDPAQAVSHQAKQTQLRRIFFAEIL
jgi:hypothetical protein